MTGKAELDSLAVELRIEAEAAEASLRDALGHALRAGELLIEAKGKVKHGEWLRWLEANFPGSERTAQGYMKLAANPPRVSDLESPTVRGALAELAEPREEPPEEPPEPTPVRYPADEEEIEGEIVEEPPGLPAGMERVNEGTLRAAVGNLIAQSRSVERLLDSDFTVLIHSDEDRISLSADIEWVSRVAHRLKEAPREEENR